MTHARAENIQSTTTSFLFSKNILIFQYNIQFPNSSVIIAIVTLHNILMVGFRHSQHWTKVRERTMGWMFFFPKPLLYRSLWTWTQFISPAHYSCSNHLSAAHFLLIYVASFIQENMLNVNIVITCSLVG